MCGWSLGKWNNIVSYIIHSTSCRFRYLTIIPHAAFPVLHWNLDDAKFYVALLKHFTAIEIRGLGGQISKDSEIVKRIIHNHEKMNSRWGLI